MEGVTLPINQIDLDLFRQQLEQLDTSLKASNYHQVIRDASAAIDQVFQSQLLILLDIRAHAHAKQGHYDPACADAQQMVKYAPEIGAGYAREGDVFSMFGRQTRAIDAYSKGLEKAATDQTQVERLTIGRETATMKSETRVDYLQILPIELANNIIERLPKEAKSTCLSVSSGWRKRTIDCSAAWTDLTINGDEKDLQLVSVLPDTGRHIEELEVNTANDQLRSGCLQYITRGHLDKIDTLKLTALGTQNLSPYIPRLSVAFWQMQKTLTSLEVDFGDNQTVVTLADILRFCTGLLDLSYSTTSPMAALTGDFSTMEQHDTLINLTLNLESITGASIEAMLQRCQCLRRLVMKGCDSTVFDPINKYAPNLEILSYNNLNSPGILKDTVAKQPHGLREIYTSNGRTSAPTTDIFPLVYKNMATLKTAFLNISSISQQEFQQLNATYPDFKFQNLVNLTFWARKWTESLILRAARDTTTLTYCNLLNVEDLSIALTIVKAMPVPTTFRLQHPHDTANSTSLTQLFQNYSTRDQKWRALSTVYLRKCTVITDTVLDSLAGVATLRSITLDELDAITAAGIKDFLKKTAGRLTYLNLRNLNAVTDECVVMIACSVLSMKVFLENLPNISDQGIRGMVDKESAKYMKLTIKSCKSVPKETIHYAQKKVQTLVHE